MGNTIRIGKAVCGGSLELRRAHRLAGRGIKWFFMGGNGLSHF